MISAEIAGFGAATRRFNSKIAGVKAATRSSTSVAEASQKSQVLR